MEDGRCYSLLYPMIYLAEAFGLCLNIYIYGVETSLNWTRRNQEDNNIAIDTRLDLFKSTGHALGYERAIAFARTELEGMQLYVVFDFQHDCLLLKVSTRNV